MIPSYYIQKCWWREALRSSQSALSDLNYCGKELVFCIRKFRPPKLFTIFVCILNFQLYYVVACILLLIIICETILLVPPFPVQTRTSYWGFFRPKTVRVFSTRANTVRHLFKILHRTLGIVNGYKLLPS